MNKKAQFDLGRKAIYFIIAVLVLTFVFFYVKVMFAGYQIDALEDEHKVTIDILSNLVLISSECFAYEDDIGRVHSGIVDLEKFNEDQWKKCNPYVKKKIIFKIGDKQFGSKIRDLKFIERPIIIKDGETFTNGKLEVGVEGNV